jgi:hypothetical protein
MEPSMKVYTTEINDGLRDKIVSGNSLAFVNLINNTDQDQLELASKAAKSSNLDTSFATNEGQFDLHYVNTILVTTGWNKNDDVFDRHETWIARNTPEDKPFNYEHDPSDVIGHITGNAIIDDHGNTVSFENLPEKFHILTSGVLYKHLNSRDPEVESRVSEIIEGIARGEWFVSMEALFTDFDYAVVTPDGKHKTVARNEDSAFLTKHLKSYGGTGQYEQYKVGRLLKNITFSGKGLVRMPANPESVFIFNDVSAFESEETLSSFENTYSSVNDKEIDSMSDNNRVEELQTEVAELQRRLTEMDEAAVRTKFEKLGKQVAEKDTAIAELEKQIEEANASNEELVKTKEELETQAAKSSEGSEKISAELAEIKDEILKTSRISTLVDAGVDKEEAEAIVEKFANLNDEQFDSLVGMLKPTEALEENDNAKAELEEEETVLETEAEESDPAEAVAEEDVLEEAEADEDAALATAGENPAQEHQELMGSLAEFLDRSIHPN